MGNALFDNSMDVLSRALDLYLVRHNVVSDNIANAETPYFKARRVDFEAELQRAIDAKDLGFNEAGGDHYTGITANIYEDADSEVGADKNTVDMDREMAQLTKNDTKYSATTQAVSRKFALLRYAIGEGSDR